MASQFLGLGQGRSVAKQLRDVRMPAGGVEVGDALRRLVRDADASFQLSDLPAAIRVLQLAQEYVESVEAEVTT